MTVLNALKISARIWNRVLAPTGMFFVIDRSVMIDFGPRSRLREALPKVNCSGSANAAASKQLTRSRLFASGYGFDSGIGLEQSCETNVLHNTIASTVAPRSSAMSAAFRSASAEIVRNGFTPSDRGMTEPSETYRPG